MTWVNIMLTVPIAMAQGLTAPDTSLRNSLVVPGGGLVVVKQSKTDAVIDLVTLQARMPAVQALCATDSACKILGGWDEQGKLSGRGWDKSDIDGKPTADAKLTKADIPFDRVEAVKAGVGTDVHRFAGQGDREKVLIGEKPLQILK